MKHLVFDGPAGARDTLKEAMDDCKALKIPYRDKKGTAVIQRVYRDKPVRETRVTRRK